jgi:hypothetical protein
MLVATLDDVNKYMPSNAVKNFAVIQTYLKNAESKELKPILGEELYEALLSSYEGSDDMDEKYTNLLPYVQEPIVMFAYYNATHVLDVIPTAQGFGVVSTSGLAPASSVRVEAFKKSVLKAAYDAIEALLKFLEENEDDYTTWKESTSYSDNYDHIVTSAREFDKHVKINESRLVYLKILPKISEVEEFDIAGAISQELMDAIIEAAQGSGMSSDYAKIYRLLKPAVANISMAKALDYISTAIYAEGIQLHYSIGKSSVADQERLSVLRGDLMKTGIAYLSKARGIILDNIDKYPLYIASDLYDEDVTTVEPKYENTSDSKIFVFGGNN